MSVSAVADPPAEPAIDTPEAPQLELPGFEGHKVGELRLNFSGNTLVVDKDTADALKLDEEIELVVRGRVVSATHRAARSAGGTSVADSRAVFIESVELAD